MRALAPCANVSTRQHRRAEVGDVERGARGCAAPTCFMKSTTSVRPCWRMSMPVRVVGQVDDDAAFAVAAAAEVDVAQRVLRRRRAAPRRSAAPGPSACAASRARAGSLSVTRTSLPSICVSKVCGLLRLNTTRVRLPACTTLRLRSAGSSTAALRCRRARSSVSRKSSAMRGGLVMANPAGGLAGGAFSVKRDDRAARDPARDAHVVDAVGLRCAPESRCTARQSATKGGRPARRRARTATGCRAESLAAFIVLLPVPLTSDGSRLQRARPLGPVAGAVLHQFFELHLRSR